jgi:hypothetical protein
MRTRLVPIFVLVAAALFAASAHAGPSAKACSSGTVATTGSYRLALVIGPRQQMYMPAEVQKRKLKQGQVMLGGAMAMIDKVPAGMRVYDLEVHVCTKSGAVVTQLEPTITVKTAGGKSASVPVAMMAAIGKGLSDYHYGNDVVLRPGAMVTVTVTINGRRATMHATAPKSSGGSGMGMSMG